MTAAAQLVLGAAAALAVASFAVRRSPGRLVATNHAGRQVPAVLGLGLVPGIVAGGYPLFLSTVGLAALAGVVALGLTGLADDLAGGSERGFREHLRSAVRLRPTTGVLKLVVGVLAAVALGLLLGGGVLRVAASATLIALTTNVMNALDVRPGRALKVALLALVPLLAVSWGAGPGQLAAPAAAAAAVLLPLDLRERGMLGDAGSNPLGFVVGFLLAAVLPIAGVVAAAVVALALQVAAETFTISRLIDAVPPLRWLDRLGRRPEPSRSG